MSAPRLSVVIPTFDTAKMTLSCCRAVLDTAPEGTEVIVADDGSRDGTAQLFSREMPGVRVVRLEVNRGFAAAANTGVAASTADLILLLNSDAIVERGAIAEMLEAFAREPRLGVAGARLLDEEGRPQWSGGRTPTLAWLAGVVSGAGPLLSRLRANARNEPDRAVDWVSGAAIAFRREVWNAAGPLSERYRFYCQDLEFCLRARRAGWQVRVVGNARVRHALGGTIAAAGGEYLWPDLLTWGKAHYGRNWARIARAVLVPLAAARLLWRRLFRRGAATDAMARALGHLVRDS